MREVKTVATKAGETRYRVRYRRGGQQSSETFRRETDAQTFAALLDGGGVGQALAWLDARDRRASNLTFLQWHETYVDQLTGITERTREDYRALRRRYLAHLEAMPLEMVSRSNITALVNTMDRNGKAPKTIKNVMNHLSSCFALAQEEGLVAANPCKRIRLPKQQLESHEARFLTHDEAGRLIAATAAHYRPFVAFLFGTGLRWSEATALEGRHVDLEAGTVRVLQAWKREPSGDVLGPPKSLKSRRTVNASVIALAAAAQVARGPSELVFTTPTGRRIHYSNFRERVWLPACKAAGLDPHPTPHDARHTFASWLLSDGQPIEAVQDQLGHESLETTRKVYAHLMPAVGVAAGKSASAALRRALVHQPQVLAALSGGADQSADPGGVDPDVDGGGDG